jgi:hypothetical protein
MSPGKLQTFDPGEGAFTRAAEDQLLIGSFGLHSLSTDTGANGSQPGRRLITYDGGVLAIVLTAPIKGLDDGKLISFLSTTAHAHTVTLTGHLIDGNGHVNHMTLGAHAGAGFSAVAYQGSYYVVSANFATGS